MTHGLTGCEVKGIQGSVGVRLSLQTVSCPRSFLSVTHGPTALTPGSGRWTQQSPCHCSGMSQRDLGSHLCRSGPLTPAAPRPLFWASSWSEGRGPSPLSTAHLGLQSPPACSLADILYPQSPLCRQPSAATAARVT